MVSFVLAQTLRVSHSKTPGMGSFPDAAVNLKLAVPDVHHSPVYIYDPNTAVGQPQAG